MGLKLPNGLVGSRPDWSRRRGDVSASRQLLSEPSRRRCIGPQAVLAYLARYTHRVAISNSRLLTLDQAEAKLKVRPLRPVSRTECHDFPSSFTALLFRPSCAARTGVVGSVLDAGWGSNAVRIDSRALALNRSFPSQIHFLPDGSWRGSPIAVSERKSPFFPAASGHRELIGFELYPLNDVHLNALNDNAEGGFAPLRSCRPTSPTSASG